MKGFARYTISGQFPAFTVVFAFSLLAFILPLSAILSGGAIVLVSLHASPKNGLLITAACVVALAICSYLFTGYAMTGVSLAVVQLVPSLILASIFYRTRSLSFSLQAAAILGVLGFLSLTLLVPDIHLIWEKVLYKILTPVLNTKEISEQDGLAAIQLWSQYMSGILIASTVLMHSTILLLGYWWHCLATDSNQFQPAFRQLRLGKVLAMIAIALGVLAFVSKSIIAAQLCGIISILFFLQGMAVIHSITAAMTKGRVWLIITYALVIVVPHAIAVVVLAGLTDTFINMRKRI